jgi:rubrerythrin
LSFSFSSKYYACLAIIEDETSKLYEKLVDQCKDETVKLLLLNILYETKKHKELLFQIANLKKEFQLPTIEECEKEAGYLIKECLKNIQTLKMQIEQKHPIINILKKLIEFEDSISEEYLIMLHGEALKNLEEKLHIKEIVKYIAEDEKRHINLLELSCKLLNKKL